MARSRDFRAEYRARQARARRAGFGSYYEQRLARARAQHPGISRKAARGHAPRGEREADRLLRRLRRGLPPGSDVHFTGTDRQPDGTWHAARFDVFAGDGSYEDTFEIPQDGLGRLVEIRDAIAATGIAVLGAAYFEKMLDWLAEHAHYAIRSRVRSGRHSTFRWLSGTGKEGRAVTRRMLDSRVLTFETEASAESYRRRLRRASRFLVLPI